MAAVRGKYLPLSVSPIFTPRLPRKKVLIKYAAMTIVFLTLFVLTAVFTDAAPALAFPFAARGLEFHGGRVSQLRSLVNSPRNKRIFSQLQNADNAYFDQANNVVGTLDFPAAHQYQRQPYVANGFIGSRIPNLGQGFAYDTLSGSVDASEDDLSNGWPLFNKRYAGAFAAGFYNLQPKAPESNFPWLEQYGYESFIAAIPQWTTLTLSAEFGGLDYTLDPLKPAKTWGKISEYLQNLSLADGIVLTLFTWQDKLQIQIDVIAHRDNVNLGVVSLQVRNPTDTAIAFTVTDTLSSSTSQRVWAKEANGDNDGIYILYSPENVDYAYAATYSYLKVDPGICTDNSYAASAEEVSRIAAITVGPRQTVSVTKFVGIVTSDLDPEKYTLFDDLLSAAQKVARSAAWNLNKVVQSHKDAWAKTLGKTLTSDVPDDPLLTMALRASIFHLSANTREGSEGLTSAMGVTGLSSDSYGGMVFWDTDLWMLNGILPYLPSHSKSMVNYRVHTHAQALDNINSPLRPKDGFKGAIYPWTSGRHGNCTATGPCFDYEYHLNTAIALSAWKLYLSGAVDDNYLEDVAYPLINDAALLLSTFVEYNDTLKKYTTTNMTDPDEYANHVDNAAYTNAGISANIRFASMIGQHLGKDVPSTYQDIIGNVFLPLSADDDQIVLEYSGMNSSVGVKQADVIMLTYPLENEEITQKQALSNMDFYSMKQVNFGPAMTYPIFSVVAANLQTTGCSAHSYLLKAVQPFIRAPFAQFSEQNNDNFKTNGGTHPAFPFMTAHGGFLQACLQGLLGFRYTYAFENGKIHRRLRLEPLDVPQFPNGLYLDGINYLNHSLTLNVSLNGLSVFNNGPVGGATSSAKEVEIILGAKLNNSTVFKLGVGQEVLLPVFTTAQAYSKSFTECSGATFTNITDAAYGDSTVSVNDGDNTTHWQSANIGTSKILVDFKEERLLTSGFVNWGDRPPTLLKLSAIPTSDEKDAKNLLLTDAILGSVDFGNDLHKKFSYFNPTGTVVKADHVFKQFYSTKVDITEPYDPKSAHLVKLQTRYNITTLEIPHNLRTRFVLMEFSGVHDSTDEMGAKIYEINFN